jgi:hypothetical protein
MAVEVGQGVEHLPGKHAALCLNSSTAKASKNICA